MHEAIINNFSSLEAKDKFTTIGIILTALISSVTLLFSILNNRRNLYTNTILKERLESLNYLKENSASFISLLLSCRKEDVIARDDYKRLIYLSNLIEYQFNKSKYQEKKNLQKINYLMNLIQMKSEFRDMEAIEKFIKDKNLDFFISLNLNQYNWATLNEVIIRKINQSVEEVDELLKEHIKLEWEKIKKSQKNLSRK